MSQPAKSDPPPSGPHDTAADPRPHVAALLELRSLGWHVTAIRPDVAAPALWRVAIERYDGYASIVVTEADPDEALDELIRYAVADADCPAALAAAFASAADNERPHAVGALAERLEEPCSGTTLAASASTSS